MPDVGALALPGTKAETGARHKAGDQGEGVRGLKALGVRELNYRLSFLACSVTATSLRVSNHFNGLYCWWKNSCGKSDLSSNI